MLSVLPVPKTVSSPWKSVDPEIPSASLPLKSDMSTATQNTTRLSVSEKNLQTAAARLLTTSMKLVSAEVDYLRRTLGKTATQSDIDANVVAVRKMPWASIYAGE